MGLRRPIWANVANGVHMGPGWVESYTSNAAPASVAATAAAAAAGAAAAGAAAEAAASAAAAAAASASAAAAAVAIDLVNSASCYRMEVAIPLIIGYQIRNRRSQQHQIRNRRSHQQQQEPQQQ
jgi:hypothetical protein